ncbi:MAG TPA: hypothetical protein VHF22_09530 [Planctomycetota bacterium]|nr:hypothetical protein [Planctomycetota bacterium]
MSICPLHPAETILGACERCGDFVCGLDSVVKDGKRICARCGERESDWLEGYRQQLWGKRDSFAAFYGGLVPVFAALGAFGLAREPLDARSIAGLAICALAIANGIAYLGRARIARWGAAVLPLALPALASDPRELAPAVAWTVILLVAGAGGLLNVRNRLSFRIPVTDKALRRDWEVYANNPRARSAFLGSFLGLLIPGVALFTLGGAIWGLMCVDPTAHPPIGRRRQAIAGIAISAIGIVGWTAFFILTTRPR